MKNKMKPSEYLAETGLLALLSAFGFGLVLFSPVPGLSRAMSKTVAVVLVLAVTLYCTVDGFADCRNTWTVVKNVLRPYVLYGALVYFADYRGELLAVCVGFGAAAAAVGLIVLVWYLIRYTRLRRLLLNLLSVTAAFALMIGVGASMYRFGEEAEGDIRGAAAVVAAPLEDGWEVSDHMDVVSQLEDAVWVTLTAEERLQVLETVKHMEAAYLGLDHELELVVADLPENTLGTYCHSEYRITIDAQHMALSSGESVLNTLCHECYHSYQHMTTELYQVVPERYRNMLLFTDARTYLQEYGEPFDPDVDFMGYYNRRTEQMARAYAQTAVDEYFSSITAHVGE